MCPTFLRVYTAGVLTHYRYTVLYALRNTLIGKPNPSSFTLADPGEVFNLALGGTDTGSGFSGFINCMSSIRRACERYQPGTSTFDGFHRMCADADRFGWWLVVDVTRSTTDVFAEIPSPPYYDAVYMTGVGGRRAGVSRACRFLLYIRSSTTSQGLGNLIDVQEDTRSFISMVASFATTLGNAKYSPVANVTWDAAHDFVYVSGDNYEAPGA
jgi:hypothetical protein